MLNSKASAAVAIIKRKNKAGEGHFLILRRAADPRDPWSGHFSFPGGRREKSDKDILATCLRETEEETGICLKTSQLDQSLPLEPAGRNFNKPLWVRPFFFTISTNPPLLLEKSEIQTYHWLDAEHFKDYGNHRQVEMLPGRTFPAYPIEDYYLWGFTYRLLSTVLQMDRN